MYKRQHNGVQIPTAYLYSAETEAIAREYTKSTVLGAPAKFSGQNKNITATSHWNELTDWLEDRGDMYEKLVDKDRAVNPKEPQEMVKKFKQSLTGKARDWFDALKFGPKKGAFTNDDWLRLKSMFLSQFGEDGVCLLYTSPSPRDA